MAYIGRDTDKLSNIEVLDAITFDGSSSYTLQKNSVNFTPSSANNVLVSIDGVVQANNFTVSGSTIDFGVAVPGTSTCDWIYHIGVGLITTPADGTVTTGKLADGSVTSAKLSGVTQGITQADEWRLTANQAAGTNADITTNLERNDNASYGRIGTGMTESSGIFSFPETGIYMVRCTSTFSLYSDLVAGIITKVTTDNSTYSEAARADSGQGAASNTASQGHSSTLVDVTDITNVKVKFTTDDVAGTSTLVGASDKNRTSFEFIRLGDT